MAEAKLSLHRKLAQIMYEAERIPKNGTAPREMGGYKFVQVGDAVDYIRKALSEQVLTMMPTGVRVVGQTDRATKSGGNMTTLDIVTSWTITDGETGESITIESFGAGADGGDKYSGKATTSAMKYAVLSGFLLSTGDDTEASNLPEQRHTAAPTPEPAREPAPTTPQEAAPTFNPDGGIIGTIAIGNAWLEDLETRQTPEGPAIGFIVKEGRSKQKVQAIGPMATALGGLGSELIGQTVTCWGTLVAEEYTPKGMTRAVSWQVLHLERIHGASFDIPAPDFSPAEQAAIDKALGL